MLKLGNIKRNVGNALNQTRGFPLCYATVNILNIWYSCFADLSDVVCIPLIFILARVPWS